MKTVEDFYKKYSIEEFYDWQQKNSVGSIRPFRKDIHKKLSFGIIPGYRNYDLFYERYLSACEIFEKLGVIKDNIKILDVGPGEGFFKFFFDAYFKEKIDWYGVEVWKERAEFCNHIGYKIDEVDLEKGALPYDDGFFDIVLASHVIEHLPNPKEVINEMERVLKKGGHLLIATPTKFPGIAEIDSFYHKISKKIVGATQQAFTHKSLEKFILSTLNLPKEAVVDKRGFRIFSSRKKLPLENSKTFCNISKYLGRKLMYLVPEVNIIIRK